MNLFTRLLSLSLVVIMQFHVYGSAKPEGVPSVDKLSLAELALLKVAIEKREAELAAAEAAKSKASTINFLVSVRYPSSWGDDSLGSTRPGAMTKHAYITECPKDDKSIENAINSIGGWPRGYPHQIKLITPGIYDGQLIPHLYVIPRHVADIMTVQGLQKMSKPIWEG